MNNPPAFPTHHNARDPRTDGFANECGMSLRDWFAGMALQGYLAAHVGEEIPTLENVSKNAFKIADAMLVEREKES